VKAVEFVAPGHLEIREVPDPRPGPEEVVVAVIGTFGYASEFRQAAELITSGTIEVAPLISRVVGLDELPRAFAELAADRGQHQKVLVCPNPGLVG